MFLEISTHGPLHLKSRAVVFMPSRIKKRRTGVLLTVYPFEVLLSDGFPAIFADNELEGWFVEGVEKVGQ